MTAPTPAAPRTPTTAGLAALERLLEDGGGTTGLDTPALPAERVLQALLTRGHGGRLVLANGRGELVFGHGKVLRAKLDHLWGLDAVVKGLALTDGRYHLSLEPIAVEPEFQCTVKELEQIVFPRLARFARTVQRGVPLAARLQVEFTRLASVLRGMPDEVNQVVRLFDGQRLVRDVVLDCRLDEGLCLEVATRLYLMGVLAPAKDAPALDAPLKAPRLFEPRARLAEDTMAELFGPTGEISAATMPALAAAGDWFEPQRGPGLDVADPTDGWAAAALDEAGAKLHFELDPELSRQLDAFRVQVVTEHPETREAERPARAFSRGQVDDGQGTPNLESVTAELPLPERTATPPMVPVVLLEEALTPSRHLVPDQRRIATPPMMPAVIAPESSEAAPPVATVTAAVHFEVRRTVTPVMSPISALPVVASVGDAPREAPVGEDAEQAFFTSGALTETSAAAAPGPSKVRWPVYAAAAVAALLLGVGFEALRAQPVTAPVVAPVAVQAAPAAKAVPVPVAAPVVEEAAPVATIDVTESMADARAAYSAGQYARAVSTLEQVVLDAPTDVEAWMLLGLARFDHGDPAGADAAALEALKLAPRNPRAYILQATVLMDRGDREAAREKLQTALEVDPDGPFAAEARALLRR